MNKIVTKKMLEKKDKSSLNELRRLNSLNLSEDELAHFGVMGMHWGVRKGSSDDSSGSGSGLKKAAYTLSGAKATDDWNKATEGMSTGKKVGLYAALGPYWGAKAANKMKADSSDPKKIVKKEIKEHRKAIIKEWDKTSDKEFAAHEAEFKAKYGKTKLSNMFNTKENQERADAYSSMLTSRMEKSLNRAAQSQLSGTKYGIRAVEGFNDWLPDFEIYVKDND